MDVDNEVMENATRNVMMRIERQMIDAVEGGYDGMDVIFINPMTDPERMNPNREDFAFRMKVEMWANEPPEIEPGKPQYDNQFQRYDWRQYSDDELHEMMMQSPAMD